MRVLALEPFYGGSHRAFLDGWSGRSQHTWTVLGLPAYKWKWRMRHAAITLAQQVAELVRNGQRWDALVCSDMLNLAEFLGLAPADMLALPRVAYFHENQLTYPVSRPQERDLHFAFTNLTTALAADAAWFNSGYHRDEFLTAMAAYLRRMPDFQPVDCVEQVSTKSHIQPPGVEEFGPRKSPRPAGPLRVLWAARWEFDKNPEMFFEALTMLKSRGAAFRVSVLGESFRHSPGIFPKARREFAEQIDHWGYLPTRAEYRDALSQCDVVVSTADHEFFGLAVVEAIAAGAFPLLPQRLAYPEVLSEIEGPSDAFFYRGGAADLAQRLERLVWRLTEGGLWQGDPLRGRRSVAKFTWPRRVPALDAALAGVASVVGGNGPRA